MGIYMGERERDKLNPGCPPSLGDIINRSATRGFLYFADRNVRIFELFGRIVGSKYSKYLSAYGYFMGTIHVRTESPAYVERFNYMKKEWIAAINIELGMEIIDDMQIRVMPKDQKVDEVPETAEYRSLSDQAKKYHIDDPE
jgi:hypothetical protein